MKTILLLILGIFIFTLPACNYFRSDHPQAELAGKGAATSMTDKSILNCSAATDINLPSLKKEFSLIYTTGDLSMYAEKYSKQDTLLLYKTYAANGNISRTVKSYYFKNDSLILVKERSQVMNEAAEVYRDTRTYLRNNVTFRIDSRTASSAAALATLPYLQVQPNDNKYPDENYAGDIKSIKDAIAGTDKFELFFDTISAYPEAWYITLKSKNPNNYKASLLVNEKDTFIDSLLNAPSHFREEKLKLNWKIQDKEAIYVPVDEIKTSASGLNK